MLLISLFIATLFLAYANGANDNFKGVATLFGSRTTSYQTAILWATFTTFAGALTSTYLGRTIVTEFTGKGILPDAIANAPEFHLAVAIASGFTVLIAAIMGFPISTYHCLIGAMFGAGLVAYGLQVDFAVLGIYFILPLFLSPIIAIPLSAGICSLINYIKIRFNWQLSRKIVDICHYISSGLFSFARGFNDTAKIVSLVLIIDYFSLYGAMITIAMAMGLGGLLNSQKIAETMSTKITTMNRTQGLSANIVTSLLVIIASNFGLPISTSYVAVSSIFGVGLIGRKANGYIFSQIMLVWIFSLPTSTIIGGITYRILQG
ncbi:inorganic phosphate transporter [Anabaena subtropica]|uniref:Inorganic phosphate transporter n=1 Tax=Anabaena subtropica FACHB-260 TaxID=2692884 RepID=A0ABR8CUG5_9NOST|nr:inorganic phosphate transporter [Anabaena subtropica]MBD2346825.1 inorganic phosphate transporter [Anabaena subtropica FACHB-260]